MEQEIAFIEQTYTHLLVQAHTRSRMTSARRHACMNNWKNTNPLSGLDGTTKSIKSANIHTSARASTSFLTYDGCTKACIYEKLEKHKSIVRARWNKKQHTFSKRRHACMNKWKNTNPSSGLDGTTKSIKSANIHTSARASTRSLRYDGFTKASMYEKLKTHTNPAGLDGTRNSIH